MFKVFEVGRPKMFVEVEKLNDAIKMATEHARLYKCKMEIRRIKGKRTYYVMTVTGGRDMFVY